MGSHESTPARTPRAAPRRLFSPTSQRERLLDGMAGTVTARGYAATSVADVLKAARISRRTFYEEFIDKEDCFLAAYDAFVELGSERVIAAYDAERGGIDGIAQALTALLELLAAEPDYARLAIVEVLGAGPNALARREQVLERIARFVADSTRERSEVVVASPELVAQAIVGGIAEVLHAHLVRGESAQLPALAQELLRYTLLSSGVPANA